MKVKFMKLNEQHKSIKPEIDTAIERVLDNSSFILGSEVEDFEKQFASYNKTKHCIGISSGTSALTLSLKALNIKPGDEIITPVNSFIATSVAISSVGAKPVFIDINKDTYNIDHTKIKKKITSKTKAILPVHLYGQSLNMDKITEIAEEKNLHIIEDACQAHGAEYKNKKVGSIGNLGCFSFYPSKNLGAFGDGGAVITNNEELAEKIRMFRNYGEKKKYHHKVIGENLRLSGLQASILKIKLKYLDNWNQSRKNNAALYNRLLENIDIITPRQIQDHVYHLYVIRTKNRQELQNFLTKNGIQTGIHYPIPISLQEAYKHLNHKENDFPVSEQYSKEILSLPMSPELTPEEITYVTNKIKEYNKH